MNRSTLLRYLLVVSLALNLGIAASLALRPMLTGSPTSTGAQPPRNLPDYLGLNAAQRLQWNALESQFLVELDGNWRAIRQHREALVRQVFAVTPDRSAIDSEQAALAQLHAAQQRRVITQLLAERELLDDVQRTRLLELLLQRYTQESTEEEQLHRR